MPTSRNIRQQTLQLLCQFDVGNAESACITDAQFNEDSSDTMTPCAEATKLAKEIWDDRLASDAAIESLTPEWPMHRQPLIDRNILRLARYEIVSAMTPPIVAIDEAIELARMFSSEQSESFINGVLDSVYHNASKTSEKSSPKEES